MKRAKHFMTKPTGRIPKQIGALLLKEVPYKNEWRIQATWRDPGKAQGKERCKQWFNNWRHAEEFAEKENKRLDVLKEKGAGRYTGNDAFDRFLKEYEILSKMKDGACGPDTFCGYSGIIEKHLRPRWGHVRLTDISGENVKPWVTEQRKEASVKTVMLRLTLFRQILGLAVDDYKMLPIFPASVKKVRVPGKLSKRAIIPHQSDLEKLRKYLNDPRPVKHSRYTWSCLRVMTLFGASCGMRPGEVSGVHFEDIDRVTGEINISKARARLAGIKGPKTEAGNRKLPTTLAARAIIDQHADVHKQLVGKCTGSVLRTKYKDYVSAHQISTWFREIMHEVGLVKPGKKPGTTIPKFPFYGLRHWSASHWTKSLHGDVHQVSKWMGHKNSSLTLDVYGHVIDDPEARARFERMPDWLNPLVEIEASPSPSQQPVEITPPLALPAPNDSFEFSPSEVQHAEFRVDVPDMAEPWVRPFIDLFVQRTPGEAYDWLVRQLDNRRSTKNPAPVTLRTAYDRVEEEFKRVGLPMPKVLAARFRAEQILALHAQKYQALDIAGMINCHVSRVYQVLRERGHNFNPNNPLNRKVNLGSNFGRKPQPEHKKQLNLL